MKGVERKPSGERTDLDYFRYRRVQEKEMQEQQEQQEQEEEPGQFLFEKIQLIYKNTKADEMMGECIVM